MHLDSMTCSATCQPQRNIRQRAEREIQTSVVGILIARRTHRAGGVVSTRVANVRNLPKLAVGFETRNGESEKGGHASQSQTITRSTNRPQIAVEPCSARSLRNTLS